MVTYVFRAVVSVWLEEMAVEMEWNGRLTIRVETTGARRTGTTVVTVDDTKFKVHDCSIDKKEVGPKNIKYTNKLITHQNSLFYFKIAYYK